MENIPNPAASALSKELAAIAEEHLKHDLRQSDRDALVQATSTLTTHAVVGSLTGLSLGVLLAWRSRGRQWRIFNSMRTHEQPQSIKFANGTETPLPDLSLLLRPSKIGGVASYVFWSSISLYFGAMIGTTTGAIRAKQQIAADPESRDRISVAMRRFRAHAFRKQAEALEASCENGDEKELF